MKHKDKCFDLRKKLEECITKILQEGNKNSRCETPMKFYEECANKEYEKIKSSWEYQGKN